MENKELKEENATEGLVEEQNKHFCFLSYEKGSQSAQTTFIDAPDLGTAAPKFYEGIFKLFLGGIKFERIEVLEYIGGVNIPVDNLYNEFQEAKERAQLRKLKEKYESTKKEEAENPELE